MLGEAYILAGVNTKNARDRQLKKVTKEISKFKVGYLVLLRNHKKHTGWDVRYM